MKVSIEISPKDIASLMVTVVEGNYMTRAWCAGIFIKKPKYSRLEHGNDDPWYAQPMLYSQPFEIEVHEIIDESKHAVGKNLKKHALTSVDFAKGFSLMVANSPHHFADFINGDYDIVTADVFLQYATLGEVVYG